VIDPLLSYSTFFGGNFGEAAYGVKVDTNGSIYLAGETLSRVFSGPAGTNSQSSFGGGRFNGDAFVAKFGPGGTNLVYFTYIGGSGNEGARDLAIDDAGHAFITGFTDSTNFPVLLPGGPVFGLTNQINGKIDHRVHKYPSDAFITELEVDGASLIYSAYLGGSLAEVAAGIALDPAGNAYITGYTFSSNFPVVNAFQPVLNGSNDVFVSKIAPLGSALLYSTYLGGSGGDYGSGIAIDTVGNAYVTGQTQSSNFPTSAGAFQSASGGCGSNFPNLCDAFVAKLNSTGTALVFSTYLGGSSDDSGMGIAVDADGNAYVTGTTNSTNFPTTTDAFQTTYAGGYDVYTFRDAFVTKLNPTGSALVYSTYLGGRSVDSAHGIAVDGSGSAYVAGSTNSSNFPTTPGAFQAIGHTGGGYSSNTYDAFVAKFSEVEPSSPPPPPLLPLPPLSPLPPLPLF